LIAYIGSCKSNYHTVTTTTAAPAVVAFFDLQSVCVQQSTQDHSHQIKFETCEEFLKNRVLNLSQSNCTIGSNCHEYVEIWIDSKIRTSPDHVS
jgi:hypothetical protein